MERHGVEPEKAKVANPNEKARQEAYGQAIELGFDVLQSAQPSAEKLEALGAERIDGVIRVPALDRFLLVDVAGKSVMVEGEGKARSAWTILVLHYLAAEDVSVDEREVSLGHFSDSRGYLSVFEKRIVGRFLATVGKSEEEFIRASEQVKAVRPEGSGLRYRFHVLPRVPITIILYAGDEELGPGASIVYHADAEHLLPGEDRIVAAELVLNTLAGAPIGESPGRP